ncbi:MAG: Ig domain-containing protein [Gemmiger formicilis]|uniref:Ig-like domain-containing protein n=1 Tax=Gemmiger formicilis TaxID=745368 RepID=UPI003A4604BE
MKKKIIVLAATAIIMAVALAGCGVKITNIAVPESAMVEKGESITLPVVYGTDDAPAVTPETAATGESAETDEKVAKAAEKLTIEWTSSDESVATVDETGTVTAVAAGEANVTASVKDADIAASTHIKVVVTPTGVAAPESIDLVTNGENTKDLDAKIVPEDATEVKLAYVSSDEGVATVDENGLVTAVADGKCTITAYVIADAPATAESATQEADAVVTGDEDATSEAATDDGIAMMPEDLADVDSAFGVVPDGMKAETEVTVSTKVEKIELDQTKGSLKVGNSVTIKATVTPDEATDKTVTWSSSDEKVATVDSNGKVTAVASGNAVITATSESNEDVKANYDVTVTDKATSSSSSSNKGTTSSKGNTSTGSSSWTGGSTSTGSSSSAGSTTTTPTAPSNPAPAPAAPDPTPVQPSNPEPAQPSNPEPAQPSNPDPAPAPDPEPVQPSQPSGGTTDGSGANGGQVIEGGADKSCPPEEHEVGWC